MNIFWKLYEGVLNLFGYNQGIRGNFFYSEEHAKWYRKLNISGFVHACTKNICRLDNGKEVTYTEMSSSFGDKATATKFDDYVLLGRGKWLKNKGYW